MARRISQRGVEFIAGWESYVGYVYDDLAGLVNGRYPEWDGRPVRGTLTIGFGHTDAAKHPLKCVRGERVSKPEAYQILDIDLDECEAWVNRLVKVPLTQSQFDALVSLTFNMGAGNLKKSALLSKLNRGDYAGARAAFGLYTRSKGKVLRGLQRRRDAEQKLWDDDGPPIPEHVEVTPKQVEPAVEAKPMSKSVIGNSQIATGTATVGTIGATVADKAMNADPTPVEKVTQVIDGAGSVVSTATTVIESVPEPSTLKSLVAFVTDPVMLGVIAAVVVSLCAWAWFERRRHSREGNF